MKSIVERFRKETELLLSDLGLRPKSISVIGLDLGTKYFRAARVKEGIKEIPLKDTLVDQIHELKDLARGMNIASDEQISINFKGEAVEIKRVSLPLKKRLKKHCSCVSCQLLN